jgi:hypothetical protein
VLDRLPEPERHALLAATAGLARLTEQREPESQNAGASNE